MTDNYWHDKRVVITGGAGMVGAELVRLLVEAGASVLVLDNFSRGTTQIDGARYLGRDAGHWLACIHAFHQAVQEGGTLHTVFNLAATVAGVEFNQSHNAAMFSENMRLQSVPLKAAAECGVSRFVQVSSVCCYSPEHNHPCVEDNGHLGGPAPANAGYAWAKRMGERLAIWYAQEAGLHTVIVRPSNIFGPHDYYDERAHVIPAMIRKCVYDNPVVLNGTGDEMREFIHAEDVAYGMMAAAEKGDAGKAYNLGTSGHTLMSMRDLFDVIQCHISELLYRDHKPVEWHPLFDAGDDKRWSNSDLALWRLGWQAKKRKNALRGIIKRYLKDEGLLDDV